MPRRGEHHSRYIGVREQTSQAGFAQVAVAKPDWLELFQDRLE